MLFAMSLQLSRRCLFNHKTINVLFTFAMQFGKLLVTKTHGILKENMTNFPPAIHKRSTWEPGVSGATEAHSHWSGGECEDSTVRVKRTRAQNAQARGVWGHAPPQEIFEFQAF